jgi:uroporphyrinogen III methyltransferase/synthase
VEDTSELDAALARLREHEWVAFTSQNGVTASLDRLRALGGDARAFAGAQICAIGPATARTLDERNLVADLVPETFTTAGVLEAMQAAGVDGKRVLLLRADIAPPDLGDGLREAGAHVTSVTAYHTTTGNGTRADLELLLAGGLDIVTFTSSSTVRHLLDALGGDTALLGGALVASIGPVTSQTARAAGLNVDVEAHPHTIEGLVAAIQNAWAARRGAG